LKGNVQRPIKGPCSASFQDTTKSEYKECLSRETCLSTNIALSPSLRLNFPSLKILDLSYNNLESSMFLANLNISSKLQKLHLVNCSIIDRNFLASSTSNAFSSLSYLDLSDNLVKACSVFYWLSNFTTNLRTLYLSYNLLEGPVPNEFGKAMNSLEYLFLSSNKLQGKIPSFFGSMCRLQWQISELHSKFFMVQQSHISAIELIL